MGAYPGATDHLRRQSLHHMHAILPTHYSSGGTTILVRWSASTVSKASTSRMRPLGLVCGLHPSHVYAVL